MRSAHEARTDAATALITRADAADTALIGGTDAADTALISGTDAADTALISGTDAGRHMVEVRHSIAGVGRRLMDVVKRRRNMVSIPRRNIPVVPAIVAAPAPAVRPFIAAPIPAGSTPAIGIPAVAVVAIVVVVELDVLDIGRRQRALQTVEQRRGLRAIGIENTSRRQRDRRHRCQNEFSHKLLHLVFPRVIPTPISSMRSTPVNPTRTRAPMAR
jgi:hypothetical protein